MSDSPGDDDGGTAEAPAATSTAATTTPAGARPAHGAQVTASGAPPFPLPGPTSSSWREDALTRVAEFRTLAAWFSRTGNIRHDDPMLHAVLGHLLVAEGAAAGRARLGTAMTGVSVERTRNNIDAAEAALLQLAPLDYVRSQLAGLVVHVNSYLPESDGRRAKVREVARAVAGGAALSEVDRGAVIGAVRAASREARRQELRLRSFRNLLLVTCAVLTAIALGLLLLGAARPHLIPLCFTPLQATESGQAGRVVCPVQDGPMGTGQTTHAAIAAAVSGWDVPVVMLLGAIAAGIAAAAAVRNIQGTSTPYSLPVALAVLKLPTGALTAVLGILLMRGNFVPGLSDLDSSAQILAWAVVFGYAQQVFTRLVDSRAQLILNSIKKPPEERGSTPAP